jgi:septum site-determining protein MinD
MIAIAGGKGGSGKTTTTLGLAAALGRRGRDAVAVDADRDMPDLHALAGVPNEPTIAALVASDGDDGASRGIRSVATAVPDHPGVAVVPAAPGVDRRDLVRGLRRLKSHERPLLVDCPAGAGPAAVDPVRVADRSVVVATATPQGLRDAVKTAALSRAVETPVCGVVVPRQRGVPAGIEDLFEAPVHPVPAAEDPLSNPAVQRAVDGVLASVW